MKEFFKLRDEKEFTRTKSNLLGIMNHFETFYSAKSGKKQSKCCLQKVFKDSELSQEFNDKVLSYIPTLNRNLGEVLVKTITGLHQDEANLFLACAQKELETLRMKQSPEVDEPKVEAKESEGAEKTQKVGCKRLF
jgi:hypothetical protein